jgi:hypothetical protein
VQVLEVSQGNKGNFLTNPKVNISLELE